MKAKRVITYMDAPRYFVRTHERTYNAINGADHLRDVLANWGDETEVVEVFRWDNGWQQIAQSEMER